MMLVARLGRKLFLGAITAKEKLSFLLGAAPLMFFYIHSTALGYSEKTIALYGVEAATRADIQTVVLILAGGLLNRRVTIMSKQRDIKAQLFLVVVVIGVTYLIQQFLLDPGKISLSHVVILIWFPVVGMPIIRSLWWYIVDRKYVEKE